MTHPKKFKAFLENSRRINKRFDITPLLYGSLGLEYVTGADLSCDDVDVLIPEYYLMDGWKDFRRFLETLGYTLIDEHEHTFERDGVSLSYAKIEELESFAGISLSDIKTVKRGESRFMILSPRQYLAVYKASSRDGYRLNVKEKKDLEKIELIRSFIKNEEKDSLPQKKLRIKHFCRMKPFVTVLIVLMIAFLAFATAFAFAERSYEIAVILTVLILIALIGVGFFLNYGLTVSNKYVTVIYFNEIRIFRYDEVTKIELWIDEDLIVGSIKAKGQKEYDVCFSDFNTMMSELFFPRLWDVKVIISAKKAEKIVETAALYDKITVHLRRK